MSLIETASLTKDYGPVKALAGLDLRVEPGIIGLVGANGAGKSTLLKILLGLLAPTSGSASVLGMDIGAEAGEIRKVVGYMPEHDCLPPDVGATEFVTHMARISGLPRTAARERTAEVLRHVGLYEERYRQIGGYSTGMKQRVKLAQSLVHDPGLLLLAYPRAVHVASAVKDFVPIALVAYGPTVVVVHPSLPARNVKDLIALAKTKSAAKEPLTYGSNGNGTAQHLIGEESVPTRGEAASARGAAPR